MKKNLSKKDKQRIREEAREMEIEDASKHRVSPAADKAFRRKAYQYCDTKGVI